jgi:hypothetical protein
MGRDFLGIQVPLLFAAFWLISWQLLTIMGWGVHLLACRWILMK